MNNTTYRFYDFEIEVLTSAFQAGDVVKRFALNIGSTGKIVTAHLVDPDNQADNLNLYFYDDEPTDFDEGDAFEPDATDAAKDIGKIAIATADYDVVNSIATARAKNQDVRFDRSTVWLIIVTNASTPTFAGGSLILRLLVEKP